MKFDYEEDYEEDLHDVSPAVPILMRSGVKMAKDEEDSSPTESELRQRYGFHDFDADMDDTPKGKTWVVPHFIEASRPIWVSGTWKVGKSLFMLQKCAEVALGIPPDLEVPQSDTIVWDDTDECPRILYLDNENLYREDILPRLRAMGYGGKRLTENLLYRSFPDIDPLNTEAGARYVLRIVNEFSPDAVVVDSISAFITGAEKEPETWTRLANELLIPLRVNEVATVMLDHPGHSNTDRNGGSSAKGRIADGLWTLKASPNNLTLTNQWARMPIEHRALNVRRTSDPLRHTLSVNGATKDREVTTQEVVSGGDVTTRATAMLVSEFNAPVGINVGIRFLRAGGIKGQQELLSRIIHSFNNTMKASK